MPVPVLQARGLVKGYRTAAGEVPVLQGLDLDVPAGEMLAVIGASGVGKSTLLHVLGTLDRPEAGALSIAGEDVLALPEPRRCLFRNRTLGFVFQFHHLLPEFSALENVAMPLLVARRRPEVALARARDLLEELGIAARADHRPGMLSGGEQQRVAVARAVARRPALLVADEPTGSLDSHNGEIVFGLICDLADTGTTVVLITHDPALAAAAHRVVSLVDGRVVDDRVRP